MQDRDWRLLRSAIFPKAPGVKMRPTQAIEPGQITRPPGHRPNFERGKIFDDLRRCLSTNILCVFAVTSMNNPG